MQLPFQEFSNVDNQANFFFGAMEKAVASTTTSGYMEAIFGSYAQINLNTETNVGAAMSKRPYKKSGFRLISDLPQYTNSATVGMYGQVPENGAFPEEQIPPILLIDYRPKIHTQTIGNTAMQQWLATTSGDDTYGAMADIRIAYGTKFNMNYNSAILRPVEDSIEVGKNYDSTFIDAAAVETMDRLISNKTEANAISAKHGDVLNYYTPYLEPTIDRDTKNTFDCTVYSASGGAIDSDNGALNRPILSDFFSQIGETGGGVPSGAFINWKVKSMIQKLYEDQNTQAYGENNVSFSMNGVDTVSGMQAGVQVSTLYNVPLIVTVHARGAAADSKELGRLYAFNNRSYEMSGGESQIGMAVAIPTIYGELGMTQGVMGMLALGRIGSKGAYMTMAQTVMSRSVSQGKIRDIGRFS